MRIFSPEPSSSRGMASPVFAQAYGYADREKKIPNTVDTPFLLASMNKLFTGLAIGQLVEQGKLSYEDPLAKFLPDFPDPESARKIKIKHLLSHTSGLGDYLGTQAYRDALDRMVTVKALRRHIREEAARVRAGDEMGLQQHGLRAAWPHHRDRHRTGLLRLHAEERVRAGWSDERLVSTSAEKWRRCRADGISVRIRRGRRARSRSFENQLGQVGRRGSPAGSSIVSALDLIKLSNAMRAGRIVKPETLRLHSSSKPELARRLTATASSRDHIYGRPFVGHNGSAPGPVHRIRRAAETRPTRSSFFPICRRSCADRLLKGSCECCVRLGHQSNDQSSSS